VTTELDHEQLAEELASDLRQGSNGRFVLTRTFLESKWLTGGRACQADIFALTKSYTKFSINIYEVKASRADFLSDVNSGKWQRYLEYCNRFYFAAPSGIIKTAEVPAEAGLLTRSEKGWSTRRAAKPRTEVNFEITQMLAVLFAIGHQEMAQRDTDQRLRDCQGDFEKGHSFRTNPERAQAERFGAETAQFIASAQEAIRDAEQMKDRYERAIRELCEAFGVDPGIILSSYDLRSTVQSMMTNPAGGAENELLSAIASYLRRLADGQGLDMAKDVLTELLTKGQSDEGDL